ncbi:MAG: response regulator [Bacteroidales bacterium]
MRADCTTKCKDKISEKTVLIAEDDFISFKLLSYLVRKTGAKVIWAQNGLEAVNICKENKNIDLVFMDICMPAMDGLEATLKIKQLQSELPVIIQTTSGDYSKKGFEAGCDEFISKPFKIETIFSLMNKYIRE